MLESHLDKNNLHHAYLVQALGAEMRQEILEFASSLPSAEFIEITTDAFKIEDARNLKALGNEKSFSAGKKIFMISANSILREAQNALLKLFEEPIPDTHFFLVVPETNALLKTLLSRFYVIREAGAPTSDLAEKFIAMHPAQRINFIKELIADEDEEEALDSARARSLQFLNTLESSLHDRVPKDSKSVDVFQHLFKVREILRMPGSSVKNLLESVALSVPVIQ